MRTVHRNCCSNRRHFTSNVIPNLYLQNTLDDTNMGCQHTACPGMVSGNRHLNGNTACAFETTAALSTSSVCFQTLSNSGKTLISAKQYSHKCEVLSSYMITRLL